MSEFRDPTTYNGISQKSFVAPTKLTAYLKVLPDMRLVEREYPALTSTKMQGGFLPLTQDNNYDVIYKQTANYRQTELAG